MADANPVRSSLRKAKEEGKELLGVVSHKSEWYPPMEDTRVSEVPETRGNTRIENELHRIEAELKKRGEELEFRMLPEERQLQKTGKL